MFLKSAIEDFIASIRRFHSFLTRIFLSFGKGVQRHLYTFVTDGVKSELEARVEPLCRHSV